MILKFLKLKNNHLNTVLLLFLIVLVTIFIGIVTWKDKPKTVVLPKDVPVYIQIVKVDSFSVQKLKTYLKTLNVKYPHIVFAQAKLESGNFTSDLFKKHLNMFGMRAAKQRPKTYTYVTKHNYAGYKTWKQSVMDYALFQASYMKHVKTEEEYYSYINQYYAEASYYGRKVKEMAEEYFH